MRCYNFRSLTAGTIWRAFRIQFVTAGRPPKKNLDRTRVHVSWVRHRKHLWTGVFWKQPHPVMFHQWSNYLLLMARACCSGQLHKETLASTSPPSRATRTSARISWRWAILRLRRSSPPSTKTARRRCSPQWQGAALLYLLFYSGTAVTNSWLR